MKVHPCQQSVSVVVTVQVYSSSLPAAACTWLVAPQASDPSVLPSLGEGILTMCWFGEWYCYWGCSRRG